MVYHSLIRFGQSANSRAKCIFLYNCTVRICTDVSDLNGGVEPNVVYIGEERGNKPNSKSIIFHSHFKYVSIIILESLLFAQVIYLHIYLIFIGEIIYNRGFFLRLALLATITCALNNCPWLTEMQYPAQFVCSQHFVILFSKNCMGTEHHYTQIHRYTHTNTQTVAVYVNGMEDETQNIYMYNTIQPCVTLTLSGRLLIGNKNATQATYKYIHTQHIETHKPNNCM